MDLQEAKYRSCAPLIVWYEKLKTHMWRAIEVGEGERIRHIFNTCLKHVQDVHVWPKESDAVLMILTIHVSLIKLLSGRCHRTIHCMWSRTAGRDHQSEARSHK
ncbi:hypothetical protein Y032_0039g89 [Ancylostoma ceylanicum]|uniref:Uncharacterized protein n=1 Tax=Ancylostoma ceylanicum TaxID=53326 RepID=A0A016UJA6_9BILA|nr:hypothetical protein Y032_0039g89 [Ancylostoma ceylanicum]